MAAFKAFLAEFRNDSSDLRCRDITTSRNKIESLPKVTAVLQIGFTAVLQYRSVKMKLCGLCSAVEVRRGDQTFDVTETLPDDACK